MRSIIIALAVIIAEVVPQFDLVMGIIGGTLTGPMIFILPPLFYRRLIRMERDFDENNDASGSSNSLSVTHFRDDEKLINDPNEPSSSHHHHSHNADSYGTFTKQPKPFTWRSKWLVFLYNESLLCVSVIIFGLIVTITSTYFNLLTASDFDEFYSPCIQNFSLSFGEL